MKKYLLLLIFLPYIAHSQTVLTSSDANLVNSFNWAKTTSCGYRGNSSDPVGPWYESSLPSRESFCMRDASHQCIGAEILGETAENKNMFQKFADNISVKRDYCSYWEITRYNTPTPCDYSDDTNFWYNLPGNLDMINACWRLYKWTGNQAYIKDANFKNFYKLTLNQYITKWQLDTASIMQRPRVLNGTIARRGISSYVESVETTVGVDLVAALYQAYTSYANILKVSGASADSIAKYKKIAMGYSRLLDKYWWDESKQTYNTYKTPTGTFGKNEGEQYLLWFDVLTISARKNATLNNLAATKWNVETMSYYPLAFYQNGRTQDAYKYIMYLSNPKTPRIDYPEVSHGVIQGIVNGMMGIDADASNNLIQTQPKLADGAWVQLENLPVFGKKITVKHFDNKKTSFTNNTDRIINWKVSFTGKYPTISSNAKKIKTTLGADGMGNPYSYAIIKVRPAATATAFVQ